MTLSEFADTFGKSRTWAYELRNKGKLRTIEGYGDLLVPRSEVGRILNSAEFTNR
jgi:hypothetical protein